MPSRFIDLPPFLGLLMTYTFPGVGTGSFAEASEAVKIRAARRFAARAYVLAAESTLDMASDPNINRLSADVFTTLLLVRNRPEFGLSRPKSTNHWPALP